LNRTLRFTRYHEFLNIQSQVTKMRVGKVMVEYKFCRNYFSVGMRCISPSLIYQFIQHQNGSFRTVIIANDDRTGFFYQVPHITSGAILNPITGRLHQFFRNDTGINRIPYRWTRSEEHTSELQSRENL